MSFKDSYNFSQLTNESEEVVIEELEQQLEDKNESICRCEECILDMAAFALSKLPTAYRATFAGRLYAQQYHSGALREQIIKAVSTAIAHISKNPSHD